MRVVRLRRPDGFVLLLAREVFDELAAGRRFTLQLLRDCGYLEVDRGQGFEPLPPPTEDLEELPAETPSRG